MANEEPPYLTVGTEVSAKYKGAFCEAKVKKVIRSVRCKVVLKNNMGAPVICQDDHVKGTLRVGAHVEVKQPDKNVYLEGIINKLHDQSQYTVVFDDGDETTLRRTSLCLKSGRHFAESETLDQLPLTHPEHFGTPVMGSKGRKRRSLNRSMNYDSSDDDPPPRKKEAKLKEPDPDVGKVVCVEMGDKKKTKDNWFPALVVSPSAQDTVKIDAKTEHLVRSFKDGKYYCTTKKDTREFTKEIGLKVDNNTLKTAVEKATLYTDRDELPPHWDREILFRASTVTDDGDTNEDSDSETSDDEPSEEKDRFVAQLYKFMDDRGTSINRAPTVSNRDLNLYKLFKMVQKLGGYNRVTNHMQWKTVYTKMGLPGYNTSSSHHIKQAYKRYLHSFEDFYRKLGCTMGTSTRSGRMRHLSGRGFILTRDRDREFKAAGRKLSSKQEPKEKKREDKKGKDEEKVKIEEKVEEPKCRVKEEDKDDNQADDEADDEDEEEQVEQQEKLKLKEEKKTKIKKERLEKKSKTEEKDKKVKADEKDKRTKPDDKAKKLKADDKEKKSKPEDTKSKPEEKEKKPKIEEKEKRSKLDEKEKKQKVEDKDKKSKPEEKEKKNKPEEKKGKLEEKEKKTRSEDKEKRMMKSENKEKRSRLDDKDKKNKNDDREKKSRPEDKEPKSKPDEKERRSKFEERERSFRPKPRRKTRDEKHDDGPGGQDTTTDDGECLSDIDINVGDKVRVKYGRGRQQKIYEAKVLELEEEDGEKHFYVHYTGWNMRYDEWVKRHRIVENLSQKARKGRSAGSPKMPVSRVPPGKQRGRPSSASGKSPPNRKLSGNSTVSPRPRITRSDKSSLADSPFPHGIDSRRRTRTMSDVHLNSDEEMNSSLDSDDLDLHFSNDDVDDSPVESASDKGEIEQMEEPKGKRKDKKGSVKDKCDISHDDDDEDGGPSGLSDDNEDDDSPIKELPSSKSRISKLKDIGDGPGTSSNKVKGRGKVIKKEKVADDSSSIETARQKRRTRNVREDSDTEQDNETKIASERKHDNNAELAVKPRAKPRRSFKTKADDSGNEVAETKEEEDNTSSKTKLKGKARKNNKVKTSDIEDEVVQEADVQLVTKSKAKSRRLNRLKPDESEEDASVSIKEEQDELITKSKGRSKRVYKGKKDDTEDEAPQMKEDDNNEVRTKSKGKSRRKDKVKMGDSDDESEDLKSETLVERGVKTKGKARRSFKVKMDGSDDEPAEFKEEENIEIMTKSKGKSRRSYRTKVNGSDDEVTDTTDFVEPSTRFKGKTRRSIKMQTDETDDDDLEFKEDSNIEQMLGYKCRGRRSYRNRADDSDDEVPEESEREEAPRPKRKGQRKSPKIQDDVDDDERELEDSFDETKITSQEDSDSEQDESKTDGNGELMCSDLRPPKIPEGIIVSEDNDDFSFLDGITGDCRQEVDETKEEAMEEAAVLSIMQEEISQETEDGEPFSLNMDICLPSVGSEPITNTIFSVTKIEPVEEPLTTEPANIGTEEAVDAIASTEHENKESTITSTDTEKNEEEEESILPETDISAKAQEDLNVEDTESDTKVRKTKRKAKSKRDKDVSDEETPEQCEVDIELPLKRGKQKPVKGNRSKKTTEATDEEMESDTNLPETTSPSLPSVETTEPVESAVVAQDVIEDDTEKKPVSESEIKNVTEDSSENELVNVCSVIDSVILGNAEPSESSSNTVAPEVIEPDLLPETTAESVVACKVEESVVTPEKDEQNNVENILPTKDPVVSEETESTVESIILTKTIVADIPSPEVIEPKKEEIEKVVAKETKKEKSKHVKDEERSHELDIEKVDVDVKKKKSEEKKIKEGKVKKSKDKKSKSKKDDGLKSDKDSPDKRDGEKIKKKESKKKKEAEKNKKAERLESDLESGDRVELQKKKSKKNKLDDKKRDGDSVKKKSKKKTPKEHKIPCDERGSEDDINVMREGKRSGKKGDKGNKTKRKKDRDRVKKDLFDDYDSGKVKSEKEHKKSEKRSKDSSKQQLAESKAASMTVKQEFDSDEMENLLLCKEDVPLSPVAGDSQLYRSDNSLPMCSSQESRYELSISSVSCVASGSSGNISVSGVTTDECSLQSYMKHEPEQSTVLDNTPPTTPESALSTMSGSLIHDRESASPVPDEETQSTKSGQDCSSYMDLESYAAVSKRMLTCHENVDFAQSEAAMVLGSLGTLQAFDKRQPALVENVVTTTKRLRVDNEDHPPRKRKKSRRRSHSTSEVTKSSSSRHRHSMCKMSKTASDSDEALHIDQSHTSAFHQLSQVISGGSSSSSSYAGSDREGLLLHGLAPRSPRPSKFNFYVELDDYLEGSERIAIIQEKLTELRKTYMALKAEVACIDRRRKKLRRKEKEASTTVSSTTEVECS